MSTPPIGPSLPPPAFPPDEGIPLRDRVHRDLQAIEETGAALQKALSSEENPSPLLDNLQAPVQDLAQLTRQSPPVLSQNEIDVIKTMNVQFELMQMDSEAATPSGVAALQGSASTLEQLFAAERAKIPEPNASALLAQNTLSALADALQLYRSARHENRTPQEGIIDSMKKPLDELSHLSEKGIFTHAQSETVATLNNLYGSENLTRQTLAQFQENLHSLNHLLTGLP